MNISWILASYPISIACNLLTAMFFRSNRSFVLFCTSILPAIALCLWMFSGRPEQGDRLIFSFITPIENSGFPLIFQFDSLRISLLLLLSILCLLIQLYSLDYLEVYAQHKYFHILLLIFQAAMAGLFLAGNLLTLFVFWELVGLISYLLVQFFHKKESVLKSAFQVIMINKAGDVLLLSALGLLLSYGISLPLKDGIQFPEGADRFLASPSGQWICLFFLISAAVKSAQFPFSVWLSRAMAGPASVSALLHSATMVAAGVWLMSLLAPVFPDIIRYSMGFIGVISLISGSISAVFSRHFKAALAFSTIAQLGLMMAAISGGMIDQARMHLMAHAFFKAALFLLCGWLMKHLKEKGIPDEVSDSYHHLSGILRNSPLIRVCLGILLASLAGLPLTSGFISKEGMMGLLLNLNTRDAFNWFLYAGMQAGAFLSALYAGRMFFVLVLSASAPAPGFPFRIMATIVFLTLASTFLLFGPHPFSSDGWLSAFTGLKGSRLFPDVLASFSGLLLAWLTRKKSWPDPDKIFLLSLMNRQAAGKMALGRGSDFLLAAARFSRKLDDQILDPAIEMAGRSTVVAGYFSSFTDRYILNGIFRLGGKLFSIPAELFFSQARHSARYVAWFAVLSLMLLIYFVYYR